MAKVPFKQIVGALIYLASQTRPDIAVALSEVCRFMANPGRQHWIAVKRILRYIKGTLEYGIAFSGKFDQVIGYADSDWGTNIDCRRSRTGFLFFANGPVSWESRLQTTVALSTVEAEYLSGTSSSDKERVVVTYNVKRIGIHAQTAYYALAGQPRLHCFSEGSGEPSPHQAHRHTPSLRERRRSPRRHQVKVVQYFGNSG